MVPGPPGNGRASQDGAAYIAREVDVRMVAARKVPFGPPHDLTYVVAGRGVKRDLETSR